MNLDRGSNGISRFHSITSTLLPRRLLGRLYLFGVLMALEYIYCFGSRGHSPGHLRDSRSNHRCMVRFPSLPMWCSLVSAIPGGKLKKRKFRSGAFFWHPPSLHCRGVLSFTAAWRGLGWPLFDTVRLHQELSLPAGTVLLALACVPPRSWVRRFALPAGCGCMPRLPVWLDGYLGSRSSSYGLRRAPLRAA